MAMFVVGQLLGNGATVVSDVVTASADGTTVEEMHDSRGNSQVITTPGPNTPAANQQALISKAQAALAANATFIAAVKPNTAAAQASAAYDQTVALSRQVSAAFRLLLGQLDSTSGT